MSLSVRLVCLAAFLCTSLHSTHGHATGAPRPVCGSMTPKHQGTKQQLTVSPYKIVVPERKVQAGGKLEVSLQSKSDMPFKGYLLEARDLADQNSIIGTFALRNNEDGKLVNCETGTSNGVTHKNSDDKTRVDVDWFAPSDFTGLVNFWVTFVKDYDTYWTNLTSGAVTVSGGKPMPVTIYKSCGTTKSCYGFPEDCVLRQDCEVVVSYALVQGKYVFELQGKSDGYIAVGLSDDDRMGNDSVVDCVHAGEQVNVSMSWNLGRPGRKGNRRLSDPHLGLSNIAGSQVDGIIYCAFVREPVTTVEDEVFDLNKNKYYVMLAAGKLEDDGTLDYHYANKSVTGRAHRLEVLQPITEITTQAPASDDPIYHGCAETKGCFGFPSECTARRNCEGIVTYAKKDGKYTFQMKGKSQGYVAFGLSMDDKMGADSVVECIVEGDKVNTYMSWNKAIGKGNDRLQNPRMGLEDTSGSYVDGWITCEFIREKNTTVEGVEFDLENQFYLMIALGHLENDGALDYHGGNKIVSANGASLSSVAGVKGKSNLLRKLHGAFMITSWIGAASCGILLARYFKQTWARRQICGKDVWFAWHRVIMTLVWGLTISAFVLIFIELQGWTSLSLSRNPHALLGCITTFLAFIQPIMAFFRPHPGTPNRPIFNWAHWLVGNLAQIFGIITIFFAVSLPDDVLPNFTYWILVAFVGYHCLMHLIFSIHQCQSDRSGVHVISPPPNSKHSMQSKVDAPGSTFRKLMLAFYLLVNWILTIILVLLVVFAPIDQHLNWS